ncbi:MAG: HIT domain-containing protein [Patescibacteria group bacterium]|mgnify:FL=1
MLAETLKKFGYPETLAHEYRQWLVLVHPKQATLGSLLLIRKGNETRFSEIPVAAFEELAVVIPQIERTLQALFQYDKINYFMLMMVNPEPHFHVVPRYATDRQFAQVSFRDIYWPKAPDLLKMNEQHQLSNEVFGALVEHIRNGFMVNA